MPGLEVCSHDSAVIALAGNPNTGKSTVFNSLTGLKQHTGNWPGKTVANALGRYRHKGRTNYLIDRPGAYSLFANSAEEEAARDFICFGNPDVTVVVTDATCLERNLNLVLQIQEITDNVAVCVNLMDEAKRKNITVDLEKLSEILGVPVIGTNARKGEGLEELKDAVHRVVSREEKVDPMKVSYDEAVEKAIAVLQPAAEKLAAGRINNRWIALRLIEGETDFLGFLRFPGFEAVGHKELPGGEAARWEAARHEEAARHGGIARHEEGNRHEEAVRYGEAPGMEDCPARRGNRHVGRLPGMKRLPGMEGLPGTKRATDMKRPFGMERPPGMKRLPGMKKLPLAKKSPFMQTLNKK